MEVLICAAAWAIKKTYSVERTRSHQLIANFQRRLDNGTMYLCTHTRVY